MYAEKILINLREEQLIELLKNKLFPDIIKIEFQFDSFDCITSNYYIELKCRTEHYPTMFIEKIKYDKLIQQINSIYITSTPKGIYLFELNKIMEPVWYPKMLPQTSFFNQKNYIEKLVGELPISKALEITQILI